MSCKNEKNLGEFGFGLIRFKNIKPYCWTGLAVLDGLATAFSLSCFISSKRFDTWRRFITKTDSDTELQFQVSKGDSFLVFE